MKAVTYEGVKNMQVKQVADPTIQKKKTGSSSGSPRLPYAVPISIFTRGRFRPNPDTWSDMNRWASSKK